MITTPIIGSASAELETLVRLGDQLDARLPRLHGASVRELLIADWLHVRDKRGTLVNLVANRAQWDYALTCSRRNIVLKARQLGVTTWIAARFFVQTITRPGTLTVQVAHDQSSAEQIFSIVHRFLANLPERLRQGALLPSRANVRQLVFPRLDSEYRVETAADPNAGRGSTIRNLHCSEVARWPGDAAQTLAALRAAVPPDGEITLESTPAGAAGVFYEEWQRADESGYARHFFPWWFAPEYRASRGSSFREGLQPNDLSFRTRLQPGEESAFQPTDEERALMKDHGLDPAQIRFRRELLANFRRLAAQEFAEDPVSCFLASGDCVFDLDVVAARMGACPEPAERRDNSRLAIWWPPAPGRNYIIGVDPAGGGIHGDYACAQVIERSSGMHCAELHGHFTPQELARRIAALARDYHRALLAVERNNHGHAVIAHLITTEHYENLFVHGGQPGWLTNQVTRPPMIETFAAMLANAPELFSSPRLLAECRTFVRPADGAPAAASGTHDDCVIAMAIAQMVRQQTAGSAHRAPEFAALVT